MPTLQSGDALLIVDVQNDFLPGGPLAVPNGHEVIPILLGYMAKFQGRGFPIFTTRDWHPPNHCSFKEQGGVWPPHCLADSKGAEPPFTFQLPASVAVIRKGLLPDREAYSGFEGTSLDADLKNASVRAVFVGGVATDYCVLNTVKSGLALGYTVHVLTDAIRAVNLNPEDGVKAIEEMVLRGAIPTKLDDLAD